MTPAPDDNVRVVVRCRPLSAGELKQGCTSVAEVNEIGGKIAISNPSLPGEVPKEFTFDNVFAPNSKQVNVYTQAARPIVVNVLEGYNGTIFAYGQTGTGKTFTMEGNRGVPELKGIIPNSFAHIFGHISHCGDERKFLVRVAYLEIYNEEIRDLLGKDQTAKLELKERPDIGVYVKDLTNVTVGSADEMDRIMTVGNKNRSVGATQMNEFSSRSHAIFTVTVECSELGPDKSYHVRVGKLHLVDLAGSERQSKTGASGQRLKEATKINLSLSTLGNVISALVDAKATHVPYRNSKLTRMLQDSLGGNSKTVMIANIGPADYNYDETISTLRYANRAKNIKNQAKINEDPKDALLRKFQQEIEELRKQLAEGGSGEEDVSDDAGEVPEGGGDKKQKKKSGGMGDEALKELEKEIAEQKTKLEEEMGDDDRLKLNEALLLKEEMLQKARDEHEQLAKKLEQLEKKIIVGGENLLEKAEIQERLLEEARIELEQRQAKEAQLRLALEQKQAERIDLEEKYSSLQEEAAGKSKKLKKVWTMLQAAKSEVTDIQSEQQREIEGLLDNVRQLSRELSLHHLIIDEFIPKQYQDLIQENSHWNEEIGDWQLKCVAYTGNNIRSRDPASDPAGGRVDYHFSPDFSSVYLSYAEDAGANIKPSSSSKQRKIKSDRKKAQIRALLK